MTDVPSGTVTARPSIVSVTVFSLTRIGVPVSSSCSKAIGRLLKRSVVAEVADLGRRALRKLRVRGRGGRGEIFAENCRARSTPAAASGRRARTANRRSASRRGRAPARYWPRRSRPAMILSIVSTPRVEPMRQGVHLPQLSFAQNSKAKRACLARSTLSLNTTMPPWPSMPLAAEHRLVVERRVEQVFAGNRRRAGRRPARRGSAAPSACRRRNPRPARRIVTPKASSTRPPCLMSPASWNGCVPRERPMPYSA